MTIEEQLNDELKTHMRGKNADTVSCIRQLKSKVQEAVNAKDFKGAIDDALYQRVIAAYCKSLEKGISEMQNAGERGKALCDRYACEIAYLARYMPTLLGEAQTQALVQQAIKTLGVTDPKQGGKVLGLLMKEHKGEIDPGLARKLVEAALTA